MPTCMLPSLVRECQNQWEAYVSSELSPSPTPPSHCDINEGIGGVGALEIQPACASPYHASLFSWASQLSSITKPPVRRHLSVASYAARSKTPTCTSRTPSFSQTSASHLTFEWVSRIFCEHHGRQLHQVVVVADFFDAGRAWSHTRVWPVSNVE
jgi:hypothetical protein